jgi:hypothetical protein
MRRPRDLTKHQYVPSRADRSGSIDRSALCVLLLIVGHGRARAAGDEKKTALLKGLPGAAERLTLFEADIYDAATFEPAIQGCEFVFLVATPMMHNSGSSKVLYQK